ncbi:MAG: methylmalonyl-CoA mutase small subunit [Bacteroidetes bacterium HGW-Bacteroidetes-16]|jgi:methylmalonyl-CoA mutase|nr:MAG: methylmalonyl-CoA mutase small subunit [Bacteroidetes bacterium HGW-Bacteroidetes-16]
MEKETLFNQFPPITTEAWKEKIIKDLKGADYDRKLTWRTGEGFTVQPFYREENLADIPHMETVPGYFPYVRGNREEQNTWLVRQDIQVEDIAAANAKALDIKLKGVDSLGFIFKCDANPDEKDVEALLQNIRLDLMEVNFRTHQPLSMVKMIDSLAKKYNRDLENIKGSVIYDPIGTYTACGKYIHSFEEDMSQLVEMHQATRHLPNFQYLTIKGLLFNNAGAGTVSELGFMLALGAEYLTYLTGKGLDIDEVAPHIRFHMAVGSDYFMEIAKFRAARYLWAKIVNAYGLNNAANAKMHIHCSNSSWNKTVYDPYVNMLRTTTESMSAILGGVDSLTVLPFNAVYETETDFSERIARNQQLILKGESYFDKIADPAAGSYYIETLTHELIQNAWNLFLEVDEQGGYLEALKKGTIQEKVNAEAQKKNMDIALRRKSILGTNQYPNTNEQIQTLPVNKMAKVESEIETLKPYRGAEQLEKLRFATDEFARKEHRPVVWMFTYGNLAMQKARSQFAGNFFGCAGYQIVDNNGFSTVDQGIEAARQAKPDIVVICSSDEEYDTIAQPIFKALNKETIVVLAGYPTDLVESLQAIGMKHFIHVKSNLLEQLSEFQQLIGIQNNQYQQ